MNNIYDKAESLYSIIKSKGYDYENKMLEMPTALWDFLLQDDEKLDIGMEINRNIEKYLSEIPIFEENTKSIYRSIKKEPIHSGTVVTKTDIFHFVYLNIILQVYLMYP